MAEENKVQVSFGVKLDELFSGLSQARDAVSSSTSEMKGHLDGLAGGFGQLKAAMVGFAAILGGGSLFAAGVSAAKALTGEAMGLSKALGISSQEASVLNVALKSVGLSSDTYTGANMHLTRQLKTNEQGLKDMGVATRDASGNLLNGKSIMDSALSVLAGYKEGTDRNIAAQQIFGRGTAEATALLKMNTEANKERAKVLAEELGLVIGPQQAGNLKAYKDAMADVSMVLDGIQNTIGQALLPVLTELAVWFSETGPARVKVMTVVMDAVADVFRVVTDTAKTLYKTVVDVFGRIGDAIAGESGKGITAMQFLANVFGVVKIAALGLEMGVVVAFEAIGLAIDALVIGLRRLANVAVAAFNLDWAGVKSAWSSGTAQIEAIVDASAARMTKKAGEIAGEMSRAALGQSIFESKKYTAKVPSTDGDHSGENPGKDGTGKKDPSQVGEWERINKLAKESYELQHDLQVRDLAVDLAYWRDKLEHSKMSTEDRLKVQEKVAAAELAIMKKAATENKAMNEATVNDLEKGALNKVAITKAEYETELAMGRITAAQMIEAERMAEDASFQIRVAAQQAREMLVANDPNVTPSALKREKDKLLEIERAHALAVVGINKSALLESTKNERDFFKSIQDGMAGLVGGMVSGTTKMSDIFKASFGVIRQALGSLASEMVKSWITAEATKTGASAAGAATRGEIEAGAALKSVALTAWTSIKNIMTYAWEAMAGAYKAIAGIPIVGPALAPVAAGVAFAGVAGMAKSIMSARGGFDIPAGMNPITQLHEREMVLPEKHADVVRRMADGGGGGGGDIHIHNNINAMDGASVRRVLMSNPEALAASIKKAVRNGFAT
jgi:hypothetical protein